jgi:hypothetical protein
MKETLVVGAYCGQAQPPLLGSYFKIKIKPNPSKPRHFHIGKHIIQVL